MQDYLGHRDPKHTVHYTRVAFEGCGNERPRYVTWERCNHTKKRGGKRDAVLGGSGSEEYRKK